MTWTLTDQQPEPEPRWAARKQADGWAVTTPSGDQYATAHTQTAAIGFATQMAGVERLLQRVQTAALFERHRKRVEQLRDAFEIVTETKVPV